MADTNAAGRSVNRSANASARRSCNRDNACISGVSASATPAPTRTISGSPATSEALANCNRETRSATFMTRAAAPKLATSTPVCAVTVLGTSRCA
jgi:hypothetical protein